MLCSCQILNQTQVNKIHLQVSYLNSLLQNRETWYSRSALIRTLVIRIGLALQVNLSRILQN
jgi:hypothetical protein